MELIEVEECTSNSVITNTGNFSAKLGDDCILVLSGNSSIMQFGQSGVNIIIGFFLWERQPILVEINIIFNRLH